jgi:hypothetical protein
MMRIIFRNMDRSQLAIEVISERMQSVFDKFKRLNPLDVTMTLKMDNSPVQAGPDLFCLKFYCNRGTFKGLAIEKRSPNLYIGLADLVDTLCERLGRNAERQRHYQIDAHRKLGDDRTRRETAGDVEASEATA